MRSGGGFASPGRDVVRMKHGPHPNLADDYRRCRLVGDRSENLCNLAEDPEGGMMTSAYYSEC